MGRLNDTTQLLTVGGYTSAWAPAWNAVREKAKKGDKHPLAFRYDSSAAAPGDQAVFYRQHIPTLVFSTGNAPENAGEPVNCEGELRVLKFIEALIERAP